MKNLLQLFWVLLVILPVFEVSGQAIVTKSDSLVLKRDTAVNLILQKHRGLVQWQISSGGNAWTNLTGKTRDTLSVYTDQSAKYRAKMDEGTCQSLYTDPVSIVFIIPTVITDSFRINSMTTATGGGMIAADGGTAVTARGICWSTSPGPTIAGNRTTDGSGLGAFSSILTGLSVNTRYFVRAYATNSSGTAYGNELSFKTPSGFVCGSSFTVNHIAGAVAPVSKTVVYGTVTHIPGEPMKCWITSNLGADRQAAAVDDHAESSAGWFWQFNRKQGYKNDGTTRTPNTVWDSNISEEFDWLSVNDPCEIELGEGWRIPTLTEWNNVNGASGGNWKTWNDPWNSALKLHGSGLLKYTDGSLYWDNEGEFWSSKRYSAASGSVLEIKKDYTRTAGGNKSHGYSVRCISDCSSAPEEPVPGSQIPSQTTITWNWNAVPGATGYKGNSSDDYNTAVDLGTDTTFTEPGLACGTAYKRYVWAYNVCGISHSALLSSTTLACPACGTSITVNHVAGTVAPVSKTVTYGTVTNIPGEPSKCWITRNLGADRQATAVDDSTEASAGWYWQFNRKQGYKHDGISRTPNSFWDANINEELDWQVANDPCTTELGEGWHVPTLTEWTNVNGASGGNWTTWNGPWNSGLKLHASGLLRYTDGTSYLRGFSGHYSSSTRYSMVSDWLLEIANDRSRIAGGRKSYGYSVRCVREP